MTAGFDPTPTVPQAPLRLSHTPAARVPAAARPHTDHQVGGRGWSR
jgi:hypothetical protein